MVESTQLVLVRRTGDHQFTVPLDDLVFHKEPVAGRDDDQRSLSSTSTRACYFRIKNTYKSVPRY
jgi:hypothetical protein